MCLSSLFKKGNPTGELPSPYVSIGELSYVGKQVRINGIEPPVAFAGVAPSNSMDPLIDDGHTVILSGNQKYKDEIDMGSVIGWGSELTPTLHQVVEINYDNAGWYCRTQGTNNSKVDPFIIRKENIRWVALGVIWTSPD